jgi:L-rhamnose-H+ transport protein
LVRGQIATIASRPGASWVLAGVAAGALGIAICGFAGRMKERDLDAGAGKRGEFCLWKGLTLSLVAGVLSAVYGLALEVAAPVADIAEHYGAGIWRGNVCYIVVNTGAFITAALYSLYLARRNRSLGELLRIPAAVQKDRPANQLSRNYALALLTGTLWYGQFFFYNLGHVRLGQRYAFSSWAIHMILLVMFSNLLGLAFKEWKDSSLQTRVIVGLGIVVLCAAVMMLTYGNRLGETA